MKITIVSGSPRKDSISHRIALHLLNGIKQFDGVDAHLLDVRDYPLPLLQQVYTSADQATTEFKPLVELMLSTEAFIIVTPEYNGSYSSAVKNLFDHFPKQSKKAFGLATGSTGALGGMRCTQQLLLLVPALFGIASPHLLVTPFMDKKLDEQGNLLDENFGKVVQQFLQEFYWLAKLVRQS